MGQAWVLSFVSLFVALDVIGGVPMYLSMTRHMPGDERKKIVNLSMLVAFIVGLVFMSFGEVLLRFMAITIYDFKIAGGIVLFVIALADLAKGPEAVQNFSGSTGIVPLAVPLITGPAALTTLVLSQQSYGWVVTFAAMIANYLIVWGALSQCDRIQKMFGKDGTVVISKIAALFMAAIAVSMIRSGVFEAVYSNRMTVD